MSFSVIVPSRTDANLGACVRAIRSAGERCRVIVLDDFDGATRFLLPEDEPIDWQMGIKPFNFSRNMNIGIQAAGDDDVILLNDDALLRTPRGFSALASVAAEPQHSGYGVVAATCNNVGNTNQWPQPQKLNLREDPRMVCFVCVLIPRRTIERVGLLDERFTDYGVEDDDYCMRVRSAGLKIGIFDGCYVDHASLTSSFRGPATTGGNFIPNLKRYIEKWGVDNWGFARDKSAFKELFPQ